MRGKGWMAACLVLAGCAGRDKQVAAIAPPPPAKPEAIAPTPANAALSAAGTLWHLRAGLNVAALACRGPDEAALVAGYNALLARHAAALRTAEASYRAEYETGGGESRDRYDDAQTRLYNFWGQAHGRAGLCAVARDALTSLADADDATLAAAAGPSLAALDRAFAPPRLEVDARVFTGPLTTMVASR